VNVHGSGTAAEQPAGSGSDLRAAFKDLTGQELSDAGEAQLWRFMERAGIRSNDALWLILFGLESYRNLYADIPRQVSEAAGVVVRNEADALTAHGERVRDAMKEAMAERAGELQAKTIGALVQELKGGSTRKVIEEQAREAMAGPVRDAAAKLDRVATEAHAAAERYARMHHTSTGQKLFMAVLAILAGFAGGAMSHFLSSAGI
jgi:hypothetical protein